MNSKVDYVEVLKEAIKLTLENLEQEYGNTKGLKGKIISGRGKEQGGEYEYKLSSQDISEPSIVERIVKNILLKFDNDQEIIGWEVSYPYSEKNERKDWNRYKLDLAINYIEESNYIFRTVIEVKKYQLSSTISYEIWKDISKIVAYSDDKYPGEAGRTKYILLFFKNKIDEKLISKSEIKNLLNDAFVTLNNFENEKPKKYVSQKILKKYYGWRNDEIAYVMKKIGKKLDNRNLFLYIDDQDIIKSKNGTLSSVLLRINV